MKLALLVLGFRYPQCLAAATKVYLDAGFDIFLHIDKKHGRAYADGLGEAEKSIHCIAERHEVFWGGYSMIEAQVALLRAAMAAGPYDKYTLVSDDSFPLYGGELLRSFIAVPEDRISVRRLAADDAFMTRYNDFYFFDHLATSMMVRQAESARIDEGFWQNVENIRALRKRGKKRLELFFGQQWWSLGQRAVDVILQTLKRDTYLVESFRYTAVPDEMLFQTIHGHSFHTHTEASPMLVEWGKEPKPYAFRAVAELEGLVQKHHGFVRKVLDRDGFFQDMLNNIAMTGRALGHDV